MNPNIPVRKLFLIALYTSTAIGIITVGPAYIVGITVGNIHITSGILLMLLGFSVAGISLGVFLFWAINIALLYFVNRRVSLSGNKIIRYFLSYFVGFLLMFSVRLFTGQINNDPEKIQRILNWKMKFFDIDPAGFDYMPYISPAFQIPIIIFVVLSINTIVLIIQDLVLLTEKKSSIESENIRLKIKNIEASNQRLKQQLQPHFLFNSLNVLKTLIRKQPGNAETYLKRLSDFLRASVSFDRVNTVKFEEELKLSLDYIEMQKIRFRDAIHFDVSIPENIRNGKLPLFSIQPLLENAIKHNAFSIESPLHIKLHYNEGWITVSNNVRQKTAEDASTGMGLANLSERYRLISGDEIKIQSDDSDFSVSIKILPDEDRNH